MGKKLNEVCYYHLIKALTKITAFIFKKLTYFKKNWATM